MDRHIDNNGSSEIAQLRAELRTLQQRVAAFDGGTAPEVESTSTRRALLRRAGAAVAGGIGAAIVLPKVAGAAEVDGTMQVGTGNLGTKPTFLGGDRTFTGLHVLEVEANNAPGDVTGLYASGTGTGAGVRGHGHDSGVLGNASGDNGNGVDGFGGPGGTGVEGTGGDAGPTAGPDYAVGVKGTGGTGGGIGVYGKGTNSGAGVRGDGGNPRGDGGEFRGGASGGSGVSATGGGASLSPGFPNAFYDGSGLKAQGGGGGTAVVANGGATGKGVVAIGWGSGEGGQFEARGAAAGIVSTGGTNREGGRFLGSGTGQGVVGVGGGGVVQTGQPAAGVIGAGGTNSDGVRGIGRGAGRGGHFVGGQTLTGVGVYGEGGGPGAAGVQGLGAGTAPGGVFDGGGPGVKAKGGLNADGIQATADGAGAGGRFVGGGTGVGVAGVGGAGPVPSGMGAAGVFGQGGTLAAGVVGVGGEAGKGGDFAGGALAFGLQAKGGRADSGDEHGGAFAGILAIGGTPNGLGTGGRAIVLRGGGTGARMGAPLRIEPAGAIGAPAEGDREAGDIWLDGAGDLYLCVSKVPQTWSRLTAVRPRVGASQANTGGAVNFLPRPIRIKDSRIGGGSPLAAGQSLAIKVTETSIGGVQVPAGATGVLGTLTVTQTQGTGYLSVYPQGGAPPAEFATSNINWSAPGLDLATSFVSGVSGSGHLVVHNGIVAGSNPTHFLVDIAGYVI